MTDDEQLMRMAALAAWIELAYPSGMPIWAKHGGIWNPLGDDGQALRLAVKLEMCIDCAQRGNSTFDHMKLDAKAVVHDINDPCGATRRAIVECAAALVSARGVPLDQTATLSDKSGCPS